MLLIYQNNTLTRFLRYFCLSWPKRSEKGLVCMLNSIKDLLILYKSSINLFLSVLNIVFLHDIR